MFIPSITDAPASTVSPVDNPRADSSGASSSTATSATTLADPPPPPTCEQEPIRHMLFGSLSAVQFTIWLLYKRGYAEPNDWSQPISTGRPNEVMAILTKRVRLNLR